MVCQQQYLMNHKTECPRCKVNCQYCHDTGEHQFIEGQHKEECPKLPLLCPNNCEVDNIPREELARHIDSCLLQQIQCQYSIVSCEATVASKDQEQHSKEMMENHLCLSVVTNQHKVLTIHNLTRQLNVAKKNNQCKTLTIHNLTQQLDAANNENQHNTLIIDDLTLQIDAPNTESVMTRYNLTQQLNAANKDNQHKTLAIHNLTQQLDAVKKLMMVTIIFLVAALIVSIAYQQNKITILEKNQKRSQPGMLAILNTKCTHA